MTRTLIRTALTLMAAATLTPSPARADDPPRAYAVAPGSSLVWVGEGDSDRAYLGVQLEEETEWAEGGARVADVVSDSPASRAGLREGDVIVGFESRTIRGPAALSQAIHDTKPGDKVALRIVRDGREQGLEVEMGKRELRVLSPTWNRELSDRMADLGNRFGQAYSCEGDDCSLFRCEGDECGSGQNWNFSFGFGRPVLGVELVEVTPELREHLGGNDSGVLVSKVLSGTPAEQAGIRVGDLIVSVAGEPVSDSRDLRRVLRDKRGETFPVEVIRNKKTVTVEVTVTAPEREAPTGPRASNAPPRLPARPAFASPPAPPARPSAVAPPAMPAPPAPPVLPAAVEAYREAVRLSAQARLEGRRDAAEARAVARERRVEARDAAQDARRVLDEARRLQVRVGRSVV